MIIMSVTKRFRAGLNSEFPGFGFKGSLLAGLGLRTPRFQGLGFRGAAVGDLRLSGIGGGDQGFKTFGLQNTYIPTTTPKP